MAERKMEQVESQAVSRRNMLKTLGVGGSVAALSLALGLAEEVEAHAPAMRVLPNVVTTPAAQAAAPDAQMQMVLDQLMALEPPKIIDMTPFNNRQMSPLMLAVLAEVSERGLPPLEAVGDISHLLIPGPGGQLLIRIYTPRGAGPFPGLVYFHGGGWVIANLDTYDPSCRALCNAANCVVVSVAYRQAPEWKFPAAHEDAYAGLMWVMNNAARLAIDPAKIAVAGESAGGNLAAATTLMARDRGAKQPVHQLLVYPITNYAFDTSSYQENANAKPLDKPTMQWFFEQYLRRASDGTNPYVSPLRAPNLRGLPSATVILAQIDPLRSEGEAYAGRLREAGVSVKSTIYEGVTHEFFTMSAVIDKAKQAVAEAAAGLKSAFGTT